MKHIISIAIAAVLSLAAFGSWAQSENLPNDVCKLRGNIASMIVGQKSRGAPLEALKDSFDAWLRRGMRGSGELQQAQMKDWFNTWTGEVFERWFESTYTKYGVDYAKAYEQEHSDCLARNNAKPVDTDPSIEVK
mgnify:CR=1 FL=1